MTQQMFGFGCDDVRGVSFEYRRGELNPEDHKRVQLHLSDCAACRDYVSRVDTMLSATAKHDFSAKMDRDAMFQNIMNEVQPKKPEAVIQLREVEPATTDEEPAKSSGGWARAAIGLAAGVLIGVGVAYVLVSEPTEVDSDPKVAEKVESVEKPKLPDTPPKFASYSVQPTPTKANNIVVYGDEDASWNIAGANAEVLNLTSGSVLVEFVPKHRDAEFELVSDKFKIQVLGTVFYASESDGIVGVVTGKVKVTPNDGEPVVLERGQEFELGVGVRETQPEILRSAETHVDVDAHRLKLEAVPKAPTETRTPRKKYSPEVTTTPRRRLRDAAEKALREGRYVIAAEYYERMVDELSAADPENATLRLDLARIYIRYLKQPRRAIRHLKRFTTDRPGDPATPTAKAELCRISSELGMQEKSCEE